MEPNSPLCPCHSKKNYAACCQPLHDGEPAPTALQLMRSRYAAYALELPDYIMRTTHPKHPDQHQKRDRWNQEILNFCKSTSFENLTIVEFDAGENVATVTFTAHLKADGKDYSYTEKSWFEKVKGEWLYLKGELLPGQT